MPEFTTFVGATADGPLHDPQGTRGLYSAVLTLSRPGIRPLPEYEQLPSTALRGDSHIAMAKPAFSPPGNPGATEIQMTSAAGELIFSGHPNDAGFLAGFKVYLTFRRSGDSFSWNIVKPQDPQRESTDAGEDPFQAAVVLDPVLA